MNNGSAFEELTIQSVTAATKTIVTTAPSTIAMVTGDHVYGPAFVPIAESKAAARMYNVIEDKTFDIVKLFASVKITLEKLRDMPGSEDFINRRLLSKLAKNSDLNMLYGPGGTGNMAGFFSTAAVHQSTRTGATTYLDHMTDAIYACKERHYEPDASLCSIPVHKGINQLKGSDGHYIVWRDTATWMPMVLRSIPQTIPTFEELGCPSACRYLAEESRIPVVKATNLIEATQDTGAFVQLSGVLKRVATKLSKTCNDLRLLSSGPQAGFGDIKLPPRQAGSSIMPGKVNPVIPEVMNQVAFEVIGNDVTVTMASEAGQLQLNAFEPIMGWSLFKSIEHLSRACITLQVNCVAGIEANRELLAKRVRESITLVTALNPIIGYEKAALIAKTAMASGLPIDQVAQDLGILSKAELEALLVPEKLTQPLRP